MRLKPVHNVAAFQSIFGLKPIANGRSVGPIEKFHGSGEGHSGSDDGTVRKYPNGTEENRRGFFQTTGWEMPVAS